MALGVPNVRFVGFQRNLREFYERADIFVMPSLGPEGLPMTSLEAMAHGLPCIFSDLPVHHEITDHGKGAYLFRSGEVESLCDGFARTARIAASDAKDMPPKRTVSSPRATARTTCDTHIFACFAGGHAMNTVLVFAERMLPSTQTFIPLQVNELRRYTAQYVGLIPADRNFALPHQPILLAKDRSFPSRCRRELYRWTGVAPGFNASMHAGGSTVDSCSFCRGRFAGAVYEQSAESSVGSAPSRRSGADAG